MIFSHNLYKMEQVLSIPELAEIITGGGMVESLRMIAKLRMVCRTIGGIFATVTGVEQKTRYKTALTATTYQVMGLFVREAYHSTPERRGFAHKIWWKCVPYSAVIEDSYVFHITDETVAGFCLTAAEFTAVNKILGLRSAAYGQLLRLCTEPVSLPACTSWYDDRAKVLIHREITYCLTRVKRSSTYSHFYIHRGRIYGVDTDAGNYENLQRLEVLSW